MKKCTLLLLYFRFHQWKFCVYLFSPAAVMNTLYMLLSLQRVKYWLCSPFTEKKKRLLTLATDLQFVKMGKEMYGLQAQPRHHPGPTGRKQQDQLAISLSSMSWEAGEENQVCLSCGYYGCDDTTTKSNAERKGCLANTSKSLSIIKESQVRNSNRSGTWRQKLM